MSGWIKLHRSLLDWCYYDDINARLLLVHLLVSVNYEPNKWHEIIVQPGQLVCSWDTLSRDVGLSKQQVRSAMAKLESSGEVTRKATNKYQLVTLNKWEELQEVKNQITDKPTDKQQANNRQITPIKEIKNKRNKEVYKPTQDEFIEYANQKCKDVGYILNTSKCVLKYNSWVENDWKDGYNKPIKNWKVKLLNSLQYMSDTSQTTTEETEEQARIRKYKESQSF